MAILAIRLLPFIRLGQELEFGLARAGGDVFVGAGRKFFQGTSHYVIAVLFPGLGRTAIKTALELEPHAVNRLGGESDIVAMH